MALIIVTYHEKSLNIPITSELKGRYKGHDIYFYQTNIDSLDKRKHKQISNTIIWKKNSHEIKNEILAPPYDPMTVQIEYDTKRDCFSEIIRGKGYLINSLALKCKCRD